MANPAIEDLIGRERARTIARLREHRRVLMSELRHVNMLLGEMGDRSRKHAYHYKSHRPHGTAAMLRKFVAKGLAEGQEATPQEAAGWMLANGWQTTSKHPVNTVNSAMSHMAGRGGEGLEWAATGTYRRAARRE